MFQHWYNFKKAYKAKLHDDAFIKNRNHQLPLLGSSFNVLVWNIFKRHGGEQFDLDISQLAPEVDIFCFQEVLYNQRTHLFLPKMFHKMEYNYAISYIREDAFFEGILTASPYRIDDETHCFLSRAREPLTKTPKAAQISIFNLDNGSQLLVINLHMLLIKSRKNMIYDLKRVLGACQEYRSLPSVFAGDFNTFTLRQRNTVDKLLAEHGYQRCIPANEVDKKRYLDHIYVRGVSSAKTKILDNICSSDHYPLLCEIELDNPS